MLRPRHPDDRLPPAQTRAAVAAILALHAVAGWGLLQVQAVRQGLAAAAPMFVDLLAPPAPETPVPPPAPPPPPPAAPPRRPPPPVPLVTAAAPPEPTPAPFVAPAPEPAPAEPVVAAPAPSAPPARPVPPAPPAPPARPQLIPSTAVQYLVRPDVLYPNASRRLNETGTVVVSVLIDEQGLPRELRVLQSSGFDRLDRAAIAGVQAARFRPHTDHGRPVAVRAHIPFAFDLEN